MKKLAIKSNTFQALQRKIYVGHKQHDTPQQPPVP